MKLDLIKSSILENALDSILSEFEKTDDKNLNIETKNYNIDVYDVKIINNQLNS